MIERGQLNRTSGDTKLNSHSSRSHSIFRFHLDLDRDDRGHGGGRIQRRDGYDDDEVTVRVDSVDLADLSVPRRRERRASRGNNINKSLMTLRRVIKLLNERKTTFLFVTVFLPDPSTSLGGNA